jgi:hypothetical protein
MSSFKTCIPWNNKKIFLKQFEVILVTHSSLEFEIFSNTTLQHILPPNPHLVWWSVQIYIIPSPSSLLINLTDGFISPRDFQRLYPCSKLGYRSKYITSQSFLNSIGLNQTHFHVVFKWKFVTWYIWHGVDVAPV